MKRLHLILFFLIVFFSCSLEFNNPVDPDSDKYVGENGIPLAVVDLVSENSEEGVGLKWDNPNEYGNTEVEIVRKTGSKPESVEDGKLITKGKGSSFLDKNAVPGVINYYLIYTRGINGKISPFSYLSGSPVRFKLSYDANGATGGSVPVDSGFYKSTDSCTILGNSGKLVKTGFVFTGWNTKKDSLGDIFQKDAEIIIGASDKVLYANWSSLYPVSYNANGADSGDVPIDTNLYSYGDYATVSGNTGNLAKEGYYFAGWNTDQDSSYTSYSPGSEYYYTGGSVVLYAIWIKCFTVTYDANGAESGDVPADSNYYSPDDTVTVLGNTGNLYKKSERFKQWNTRSSGNNGTSYSPDDTFKITDNITLYAKWVDCYSIKYHANEADSGTVPVDSKQYLLNDEATILENSGNLVRDSHNFLGWATWDGASSAKYTGGESVTISNSLDLYAVWEKYYTVTYLDTGSDGGSVPVDSTQYKSQATITIKENDNSLAKTGKVLVGWTKKGVSGGDIYHAGDTITLDYASGLELEPVWSSELSAGTYGFEDGNILTGISSDWSVVTSEANTGFYSFKSGLTGDNEQSEFSMAVKIPSSGTLKYKFYYKVSSEEYNDKLYFYINNDFKMSKSGEVDWTIYYGNVTGNSGDYALFKIYYSKDSASSSGSDCAWIDDLEFYE